jgi:flagellum-specific peptidoglycan hydrolase FlgJ
MNLAQRQFLERATTEAQKANHPLPQIAACEAALESNWGIASWRGKTTIYSA